MKKIVQLALDLYILLINLAFQIVATTILKIFQLICVKIVMYLA